MRKIAIVRRNGLGDLLCAFPLVLYFKEKFPKDQITLFVDERNAPLIPFLPSVHQVIIFPKKGNKYLNLLKVALRYRKEKYDLAISAKTSPMKLMNFFLFALGAKKKVAYVNSSYHRLLINSPVEYSSEKAAHLHQAIKSLQLIEPTVEKMLDEWIPHATVSPHLHTKYPWTQKMDGPVVLLSATTTRPESRLSAERYASLVNQFHKRFHFSVLIIAQDMDRQRAESIASQLTVPHALYFPRNFEEFMVWLDRGDIYFVGDGGVAHIGAALGKKGVSLYGMTRPVEWHPLNGSWRCLYNPSHVDRLSDEEIVNTLTEVASERDHS